MTKVKSSSDQFENVSPKNPSQDSKNTGKQAKVTKNTLTNVDKILYKQLLLVVLKHFIKAPFS